MICYDSSVTTAKKTEFDKLAYSAIILNLNDYVITNLGANMILPKAFWTNWKSFTLKRLCPTNYFTRKILSF